MDNIENRTYRDFKTKFIDLINSACPDIPFIWEPVNDYGFEDTDTYVTVGCNNINLVSTVRRNIPGDYDQVILYHSVSPRITIFGVDDDVVEDVAMTINRYLHTTDYSIKRYQYDITINKMGTVGVYHKPSVSQGETVMTSYCIIILDCSFAESFADNVGYIDTVNIKSDIETGEDSLIDEFQISLQNKD